MILQQVLVLSLIYVGIYMHCKWSGKMTWADVWWPITLLSQFIVAHLHTPSPPMLLFIITLWAIRLHLFLWVREWKRTTPDRRYQQLLERTPISQLVFYQFLMSLAMGIMFSKILTGFQKNSTQIFMVSLMGVFIQILSDHYPKDPSNKLRQNGPWKFSQHPNYFGEWLLWLGLYSANPSNLWAIIPSCIIFILLNYVTGINFDQVRSEQERHYRATTPKFFPNFFKS